MKRASNRKIPSFRHHKGTGQGYVELNGKRIYLGRFELPKTRERYDRLLAEWLENGRCLPVSSSEITISEIAAAYFKHAKSYYQRPNGTPTSSIDAVREASRVLVLLYGSEKAVEFGPLCLRAVRRVWVDRGLARKSINYYTSTVRLIFKWAASHELLPSATYQALTTVENLHAGRSDAKETVPVRPVLLSDVEAVKPHVSRQVWSLIQLQLLTGARGGELFRLRAMDIDRSKEIWELNLKNHKTAYRGKNRTLLFGPRAQTILKKYLYDLPLGAHLFSPKEAERERHESARCHRPNGAKPSERKTDRCLRDYYDSGSYRRAIRRACVKADVPSWSPHQLRHTAATRIRKVYGLEAAQVVLGHSRANVTEIYAEKNLGIGVSVAKEIG